MRIKIFGFKLVVVLIVFLLFIPLTVTKTKAFVYENNNELAAIFSGDLDATYEFILTDDEDNIFLVTSPYTSDFTVYKFDVNGNSLWATPLTFSVNANFQSADRPIIKASNQGGIYVFYVQNLSLSGGAYNYQNMYVRKFDSTGAEIGSETKMIDTYLNQHLTWAHVDNSGNFTVIYNERDFGDDVNIRFKTLKFASDVTPMTSITTQATTPVFSSYCTEGSEIIDTVPYDIPLGSWKGCWDWCVSDFNPLANKTICQYNADSARSCWVLGPTSGDVTQCTWTEFGGMPPYSGYYDMPQALQNTTNTSYYSQDRVSSYPNLDVIQYKYIGTDLFIYYVAVEFNASYVPTYHYYIQKFDVNGYPQFAGRGIEISYSGSGSVAPGNGPKVDFTTSGAYVLYSMITPDGEGGPDDESVYLLHYQASDGQQTIPTESQVIATRDAYRASQPVEVELQFDVKIISSEAYIIIEATNFLSLTSESKIYVQRVNSTGTRLFPENGIQVANLGAETLDYLDAMVDNAGGILVSAQREDLSTRYFWLKQDQAAIYATGGFNLITDTADFEIDECLVNSQANLYCVARDFANSQIKIYRYDKAYQIALDTTLAAYSSIDTNVTENSDYGIGANFVNFEDTLLLQNNTSNPVAEVSANVSTDRDWGTVQGASDSGSNKAFVLNLNTATGVLGNHTLYIPATQTVAPARVLVCPNATNLEGIAYGCDSGYYLRPGAANLTSENVGGVTYWKVANLTGTGGQTSTVNSLSITPSVTTVQVNTPLNLTISALNSNPEVDGSYEGTVSFTSNTGDVLLPANYQFTTGDNGSITINNGVTFVSTGTFTVTVTDTVDGVLTATTVDITVTNGSATPTPTPTATPTTTPAPTGTATPLPSPTPTPIGDTGCVENPYQSKCLAEVEISNVTTTPQPEDKVQVCWDTNIDTVGMVSYGLKEGSTLTNSTDLETVYKQQGHCQILPNIQKTTDYIYQIKAISVVGKTDIYNGELAKTEETSGDYAVCIQLDQQGYTFNSQNQALVKFKTAAEMTCTLSYGNAGMVDVNNVQTGPATNHTATIEIGKTDGKTDIYYMINCIGTNDTSKTCNTNSIIPAVKFAKVTVTSNGSSGTTGLRVNNNILSAFTLGGAVALLLLTFVGYPRWFIYSILLLKRKKKHAPWGVVYNADNNTPMAFAAVKVLDQSGKIVFQTNSDLRGRYNAVLDRGDYQVVVEDPAFNSFTKDVQITEAEAAVALNIPLVPKNKDSFNYKMRQAITSSWSKIYTVIVVIGFIISVMALVVNPEIWNLVIFLAYLVQAYILWKVVYPKTWGIIYQNTKEQRLKGAFVRVLDSSTGLQTDVQITDNRGRFYFWGEKNKTYWLRIDLAGYKLARRYEPEMIATQSGERFLKCEYNAASNLDIELEVLG